MDLNQPPPGQVSVGLGGRRPWLWGFLRICLLAAVVGSAASFAGRVNAETSPSATLQNAWLTASVRVIDTITFEPLTGVTVGTPVDLSASSSQGLPVSFSSGTPLVCTVSGSAVTTLTAGTCTITAFDDADNPSAVTQSFQVDPVLAGLAAQTITFGPLPGAKVGVPVAVSAFSSAGLPVSLRSGTPVVCTVSGSTVTTLTAGTCTITASQAGSSDYAAASPVTQLFQVDPVLAGLAAQTITFGSLPGAKVGVPVAVSAFSSAGLPVSLRSGTPVVCTVSGSTVTTLTAGTCTITASQGGSARYLAARDVSRSFQVNGVTSKAAGAWVILLAAVLLAVAAAAATLVVRRRRLRWRPPTAPDVRAVPDTGPPGLVSVRNTGTDATHTVRIEPRPGACTTTIKEARP